VVGTGVDLILEILPERILDTKVINDSVLNNPTITQQARINAKIGVEVISCASWRS